MSHELRTQLNAIGGYVDLLEMGIHGTVTEAQRKALVRVKASQEHLVTLINDVLAFAKVEAGQIEFNLRPFAACELLSGVEPLVALLAEKKGTGLSVEERDPSLRLLGDEERVRQILLNLVGNAIKFTAEDGSVRLTCEKDAASVKICVHDNGAGIAPEKQAPIFDPFIQVDRRLSSGSRWQSSFLPSPRPRSAPDFAACSSRASRHPGNHEVGGAEPLQGIPSSRGGGTAA
jgi:signal transduction histidine kinase